MGRDSSELAEQCDVLISMVSNDDSLKEIVDGPKGLLHSSKKPKIHISMSTVSPELSDAMEKRHQEQGVGFLSAPVSGRPERAKAGTLWIFLAGAAAAKKTAAPVLEKMGMKIFDLGDTSQPCIAI